MKVLYATDGSECAEHSARFLRRFRLRSADEVLILHVVTSVPFRDDYHAQVLQVVRRVGGKITRAAEQSLQPLEAKITVLEREGMPDEVIEEVAGAFGVDMIVMGARGLKGMKSYFLGSVTRSVVINSSHSVLVTKPECREDGGAMKVLFAADSSSSSDATRRLLARVPFPSGSELTVLTVAQNGFADVPGRFADEIDEKAKEALIKVKNYGISQAEMIVGRISGEFSGKFAETKALIREGDPAGEILKQANEMKADLIALGCRGLRGIRSMMGSVSRRILDHAGCAVLVGKSLVA